MPTNYPGLFCSMRCFHHRRQRQAWSFMEKMPGASDFVAEMVGKQFTCCVCGKEDSESSLRSALLSFPCDLEGKSAKPNPQVKDKKLKILRHESGTCETLWYLQAGLLLLFEMPTLGLGNASCGLQTACIQVLNEMYCTPCCEYALLLNLWLPLFY